MALAPSRQQGTALINLLEQSPFSAVKVKEIAASTDMYVQIKRDVPGSVPEKHRITRLGATTQEP